MAIVQVKCKNLKNNPLCPHGPTLKFVRIQSNKKHKFFGCSTCRDRKDCSFYLPEGEEMSEAKKEVWALETQRLLPRVDHEAAQQKLGEVKRELTKDRLYCHTCAELDTTANRGQHQGHIVHNSLTDEILNHPSQIFKPKEGSKREAQYFFNESSTKVIVNNLKLAKVGKVICLGAPRIHEMIQATNSIDSILLDLDHRYHSFWSQDKFLWYNMFNRYAMAGVDNGKRVLARFLASTGGRRVALILDPPFGGHVEPLTATVEYFTRLLAKKHPDSKLVVIWVFPYFRERQILEKCPSLKMVDYKVQYMNHKDFHNGSKGRKLGSPVRLFTNLDLRSFILPRTEGYRCCKPCGRWVYRENKHCAKCNNCSSKDGRTYVHCDSCGICVKPHWKHCATCTKCLPIAHPCVTTDIPKPRKRKMQAIDLENKSTESNVLVQGLKKLSKKNHLEPRKKKMKTTHSRDQSIDKKVAAQGIQKSNKENLLKLRKRKMNTKAFKNESTDKKVSAQGIKKSSEETALKPRTKKMKTKSTMNLLITNS